MLQRVQEVECRDKHDFSLPKNEFDVLLFLEEGGALPFLFLLGSVWIFFESKDLLGFPGSFFLREECELEKYNEESNKDNPPNLEHSFLNRHWSSPLSGVR